MPFFKTEWRFDAQGNSTSANRDATDTICVRVVTKVQMIAMEERLRPQIEALYTPVLAAIPDAPTTAASTAQSFFTIEKEMEGEAAKDTLELLSLPKEERHLNLLAYWANDEIRQQLIGFTRIFDAPILSAVVGSPLIADRSLGQQQQDTIQRAIFTVSQVTGEALIQKILVEMRAKCELEGDVKKPVPESLAFWRSLFAATELGKTLLTESGYTDTNLRLEMSMDLSKVSSEEEAQRPVTFPEGIQVKPIDMSDPACLLAAYEVIKMAFGPSPPSFEAWKIHYASQPRFTPELSFLAWNGDEVVAAIAIERLVGGEGGGDDEVTKVFATHAKLLAAANKETSDSGDVAEPLTREAPAEDFDERKEKIRQQATVAYVCGAATKAEYRGKGLASGLLQTAFHAAAKMSLQEIILGTDTFNTSAIRAYKRAGMVETKRVSSGMSVTKQIVFIHEDL